MELLYHLTYIVRQRHPRACQRPPPWRRLADAAERVAGAVVPRRRSAGAGPPWCTRSAGSRGRERQYGGLGDGPDTRCAATGDVAAPEAVRRGCGTPRTPRMCLASNGLSHGPVAASSTHLALCSVHDAAAA